MNHPQLRYYMALTLVDGIGPVLARNLISYMGSAEAVFAENRSRLERIPEIGPVRAAEITSASVMHRVDGELAFMERHHLRALCMDDQDYPRRLRECYDAPVVVYTAGHMQLNRGRFLGVVGTRRPTERGLETCRRLVADLNSRVHDLTIVSGLAYGIDIAAHRAAVEAGMQTIAVPAHGLDRIYPASHRPVAVRMLERGGLFTEYMSRTTPDPQNFVHRNRLIAGLCDAVVVVESKIKGGSLITAADAFGYNRDVLTFPGRVGDELSAGCNSLIKRNRAALIENADDLLMQLNWEADVRPQPVQTQLFGDLSTDEVEVLRLLRETDEPLHVNEIATRLGRPFALMSSQLLQMEFKNLITALPGAKYRAC